MYSNGYVLSILKDGNVQSEKSDVVRLNYGDEYGFRLRNKNPHRCQASVHIDGEYIGTWVLDGNSSADIYRPVDRDASFLFAYKQSYMSKAQGKHKTLKEETGLIKVVFCAEKKYEPSKITFIPITPYQPWKQHEPYWYDGKPHGKTYTLSNSGASCLRSCSFDAQPISFDDGVTVDGGATGQRFTSTYFTPDFTTEVRLSLRIKGAKDRFTTDGKLFCVSCGRGLEPTNKYCGNCGTKRAKNAYSISQ